MLRLRIMDIYFDSIVDGEGFRNVVYANLCYHKCPGCHNHSSWDYRNGRDVDIEDIYSSLTEHGKSNITFSGGEPFLQCQPFAELAKMIKKNTDKTIWVYSGYTYEEIISSPSKLELLKYCDVLVDGRFDINLRDESLIFRGSSNQRIIDVQKSLNDNKIHTMDYINI